MSSFRNSATATKTTTNVTPIYPQISGLFVFVCFLFQYTCRYTGELCVIAWGRRWGSRKSLLAFPISPILPPRSLNSADNSLEAWLCHVENETMTFLIYDFCKGRRDQRPTLSPLPLSLIGFTVRG